MGKDKKFNITELEFRSHVYKKAQTSVFSGPNPKPVKDSDVLNCGVRARSSYSVYDVNKVFFINSLNRN
jgi:hypothetical protein